MRLLSFISYLIEKSTASVVLIICLFFVDYQAYAQSTPVYFIIRGTGLNNNAPRHLKIGDQVIYNQSSTRGLRLTILNRADLTIVKDQVFDSYGNSASSDLLANELNLINSNQIGILTSYDAWEGKVNENLDNAFLRLGLTIGMATQNTSSRRPYAAIFVGSSNGGKVAKAVEVSFTNDPNPPYAEIQGYFLEGSFVASGSQPNALISPQGDNIGVIVDYNGNVGIGTVKPDSDLTVNGTIHTEEVKVDLAGAVAPDYVFVEDYELMTLQQIEEYVKQHKHLPEVPSATEMEEEGINLKEMNLLLLKKVEELTLHVIGLEKEIKLLKKTGLCNNPKE